MVLENVEEGGHWEDIRFGGPATAQFAIKHGPDRMSGSFQFALAGAGGNYSASQIAGVDPKHFIVPFLSKRKTAHYQEDVRSEHALRVNSDLSYLAAKLSRIANPGFPEYRSYSSACDEILGFVVTATPSANGQRPGMYLPDRQIIPIDQMGEGVPSIVSLLADLAVSKGKLFLIEEPENDLHPRALKALLDLIIESSQANQFVILHTFQYRRSPSGS